MILDVNETLMHNEHLVGGGCIQPVARPHLVSFDGKPPQVESVKLTGSHSPELKCCSCPTNNKTIKGTAFRQLLPPHKFFCWNCMSKRLGGGCMTPDLQKLVDSDTITRE